MAYRSSFGWKSVARCSRVFRVGLALGLGAFTALTAAPAQAQDDDSAFTYAFRGLGIGVPVGAAAGYLITRDDDWGSDNWRDVGVGVAVGAIGGAMGGLAIGIADLSDGKTGMGGTVLRDTWYGTLLGATVGAIIGLVRVMDDGSGEDVLVATAWGAVIGAPVGIGVGFLEAGMRGQMGASTPNRYALATDAELTALTAPAAPLHLSLVPVRTGMAGTRAQLTWVPTLSGSF